MAIAKPSNIGSALRKNNVLHVFLLLFAMIHFLPPVSSASIPMTKIVLGSWNVDIATETPTAEASVKVAIRLYPQPCPSPGRASRGRLVMKTQLQGE